MFRQYLGTTIMLFVIIALNGLNIWVTMRRAEAPWSDSAVLWMQRRKLHGGFVVTTKMAIVVMVVVMLALTDIITWPATVLWFVCGALLLTSGNSNWVYGLIVGLVGFVFTVVTTAPGMLSIQLMWLAPLVALVGFLPKLMVTLGSRHGRPAYWPMDIRLWLCLMALGAIADTWLQLDAFGLLKLAWEFQLFEPPMTFWFNTDVLNIGDAVYYGPQVMSLGLLTTYTTFGFLSALALWARKLGRSLLVVMPLGGMAAMMAVSVIGHMFNVGGWAQRTMIPGNVVIVVVLVLLLVLFACRRTISSRAILQNKHPE